MPSDDSVFGELFSTAAATASTSGPAWIRAMLEAEGALARALGSTGVAPVSAARAIADTCATIRVDADRLRHEALLTGNPVVPLVRAVQDALDDEAGRWVHRGATSQDIIDTALVLVCRRTLGPVLDELGAAADRCEALAEEHRGTVLVGRTLLRQAVPTTFGLKAAGWLVSIVESVDVLRIAADALPVQLGGAAGTLAAFGAEGPAVLAAMAQELGLPEPVVPWHARRARLAAFGAAAGIACGTLGKIALDVMLLAQDEVGEVAHRGEPGSGGSSAMPHKRNLVDAVTVRACAIRTPGLVGVLLGAMVQEHERAAGGWHAEWETMNDLLRLTACAAERTRRLLNGLIVDTDQMRSNLRSSGGILMADQVRWLLADRIGEAPARAAVAAAVQRANRSHEGFLDALAADPVIAQHLDAATLEDALGPERILNGANALVDRALATKRSHGN